jgi:hypothetical protein
MSDRSLAASPDRAADIARAVKRFRAGLRLLERHDGLESTRELAKRVIDLLRDDGSKAAA